MKKTLIALAAVAVSSAAMAQVTLSGNLGFAYQSASAPGSANGLAVTDGQLVVTATEDLGQGMKAIAKSAITARGRDTTGTRDATLSLAGGFGTVTIGAVDIGNGIIGLGFGGAPVSLADGFDGQVLSGGANGDILQYVSPSFSGFTVSATRADSIGKAGAGRGDLSANLVGVSYAQGPFAVSVDSTSWTQKTGVKKENRTRFSGSYDLGVAKIGAGLEKANGAKDQTAFGVSVPMGAITVGAIYAKNGDANGTAYGATYAFSKTTNLNVSVGSHVESAGGADQEQFRVRLLKSF